MWQFSIVPRVTIELSLIIIVDDGVLMELNNT
jgi:hypothetical protein